MQLTRQGDYAVRIVLDLAVHDEWQAAREVAERQGIPEAFFHKTVGCLSRAGLVETARGARGGLRLARPAFAITLRDVIEAVEGPVALNRCLLEGTTCERVGFCPAHPVWVRAQMAFLEELQKLSIQEIVAG
ncbi:MAG: Rrf2 family transcriptional regulator [Clostridia bacterium]|nr:MAG: Rrf2 family transcriptional regulator [Clostridia bacterium]